MLRQIVASLRLALVLLAFLQARSRRTPFRPAAARPSG